MRVCELQFKCKHLKRHLNLNIDLSQGFEASFDGRSLRVSRQSLAAVTIAVDILLGLSMCL